MTTSNSESRKRREDCERCRVALDVKREQQRREVTQQALAAVWSGADFTDADAVLDQLADLGARVEIDGCAVGTRRGKALWPEDAAGRRHRYSMESDSCIDCGRPSPGCTCASTFPGIHCFFHNGVEVCPARTSGSGNREQTLVAWADRCLREDVPLEVLAAALPYDGAGEDEAMTVIDRLADAGWLIVPTPTLRGIEGPSEFGRSEQ